MGDAGWAPSCPIPNEVEERSSWLDRLGAALMSDVEVVPDVGHGESVMPAPPLGVSPAQSLSISVWLNDFASRELPGSRYSIMSRAGAKAMSDPDGGIMVLNTVKRTIVILQCNVTQRLGNRQNKRQRCVTSEQKTLAGTNCNLLIATLASSLK